MKYTPAGGAVTLRAVGYELFCRIDVTDTGSGIPEGKKSVAFNLTLRSDERSLTAEEADADVASILALLKSQLGAVLR